MSKLFKRTISVIMSLLILLGTAAAPDMALMTANAATEYELWVNGEQFTSDRLTITCGTGTAVFEPDSSTLTLNSAIITRADADGGAICATDMAALTVELNGTSVITAPGDDAISSLGGSITIKDGSDSGTGTLTASAASYAVYANGAINISGGRLDLSVTDSHGCAVKSTGSVNISDGTLNLSAGASGSHIDASKIVVTGGSVVTDAAHCTVAPVNGSGTALALTEHTLSSVSVATQLGSLTVKVGGDAYSYGISNVFTDKNGKLSLWLPAGAVISAASAASSTASSTTTAATTTTTNSSSVPPYVRLTGNKINLRSSAPSGSVVTQLPIFACYPCGEITTVSGTTWYKITAGANTGWVSGDYAVAETAGNYIQMTANNVNVRTSAPSGSAIDTVQENACFKYSETTTVSGTTWYRITLGTVSGWVNGNYCKVLSSGSDTTATDGSGTAATTTTTSSVASSGYLKITGSNINVRGTAGSTDSDDVLTKVNKNAWYPYTETSTVNNSTWYKITVGSNTGWVSGSYASPATESANYIKITAENINVRTTAGTGNVIGRVTKDEYYPYTATTDVGGTTCYKITVGSQQGWVVGTFAETVGGSSTSGDSTTASTTTTTTAPAALSSKQYVQATAGAVNVRNAAQGTAIVTTITNEMKDGWFKYSSTNTISGVTWYQIVIGSKIGWVSGSYVTPAKTEAKYVKVTSNLVNVRNEPNGSDVVAQVPQYCCYPFTEVKTVDNTVWYKITVGSSTGWINGSYVTINDPDVTATTTTTTTTAATTTTTTAVAAIDGTTRLQGTSRIDTAVAISKQGWANGSESVVLAYSKGYADALAGVPLASALDAPILLTGSGSTIETSVLNEIRRLGAKKVYILGGTLVISDSIANSLSANYTVTRIAGSNRYETAVAIAKELRNITGKDFTTLYFASAVNFPDALSISPVAAIQGNPVLYAPATGALDSSTAAYIKALGCNSAVIVGGTLAISDNAKNSILANGVTSVTRLYGTSRYDTSLKINNTYSSLFTGSGISISTGKDFPDALAGGALSAKLKLPVILIDSGVTVSGLKDYISNRGYRTAYIYGGPLAVANDTVTGIIG